MFFARCCAMLPFQARLRPSSPPLTRQANDGGAKTSYRPIILSAISFPSLPPPPPSFHDVMRSHLVRHLGLHLDGLVDLGLGPRRRLAVDLQRHLKRHGINQARGSKETRDECMNQTEKKKKKRQVELKVSFCSDQLKTPFRSLSIPSTTCGTYPGPSPVRADPTIPHHATPHHAVGRIVPSSQAG